MPGVIKGIDTNLHCVVEKIPNRQWWCPILDFLVTRVIKEKLGLLIHPQTNFVILAAIKWISYPLDNCFAYILQNDFSFRLLFNSPCMDVKSSPGDIWCGWIFNSSLIHFDNVLQKSLIGLEECSLN